MKTIYAPPNHDLKIVLPNGDGVFMEVRPVVGDPDQGSGLDIVVPKNTPVAVREADEEGNERFLLRTAAHDGLSCERTSNPIARTT